MNEQIKLLRDLIPVFHNNPKFEARNPTKEEILMEATFRIRQLEVEHQRTLAELDFFRTQFQTAPASPLLSEPLGTLLE